MRELFIIIVFIVNVCSLKGQILSIEFGPTYYASKFKVNLHSDIIGTRIANDDSFYKGQYSHWLNERILLSGSYSKYPISTFFRFYKENEGGAFGWNGTDVQRIDICLGYNFFPKSKFILHANVGFGFQKSISKNVGINGNDISDGIKPDNFELLKDIEAFAYSNTQIVPVVGLKFGYAFWGRFELFFDIQQAFGHKTIQELRMSYEYKGVEQAEAISYSDGTGRFYALGIGYRFVKQKDKK